MKIMTMQYKQTFLTKENRLTHFFRRLARKYQLNKLAQKMRIEPGMPPYPNYGL